MNDALCPICLKHRKHFEGHHVVWKMDGGTDNPINILQLCRTCHAILTFGEYESCWYDVACVAHQRMSYGLYFELWSRYNVSELLEYIAESEVLDCEFADYVIREIGHSRYVIAMAIIHNLITEEEFESITGNNFDYSEMKMLFDKAVFCPLIIS